MFNNISFIIKTIMQRNHVDNKYYKIFDSIFWCLIFCRSCQFTNYLIYLSSIWKMSTENLASISCA